MLRSDCTCLRYCLFNADLHMPLRKAPTEKDDRFQHMYGKLPTRTDLLHHQLERMYFDSGDFALTAAHKASNIGNIQSGDKHPLVENISRPSAPVPSGSNVDDNASRNNASQTSKTIHASGIGQEMISGCKTTDGKLEGCGRRGD
ncbi:uncharacterized protein VDAG_09165 [Verticillium dahliae VdLs.17]|uniref:mRNA stability protein n=1 Tax=Verticillium dahliae (strain VdLs.17 / ATCC MYA-4575 / FGSC 10137) TaxID=498257 RepID=G2XFP1_VERDV|nr:uncharacterized protein VDAG_09165 [Verticillium dahliae VdLs.17]EGY18639.1 hypothetical protein VDAG_09165 [Verticillium dahliae VdLs.17]